MQFLAYNSKTKASRANLTWGLNCLSSQDLFALKFKMNRTTGCWVAAPELLIFKEILRFLVIILNTIIDRDKL